MNWILHILSSPLSHLVAHLCSTLGLYDNSICLYNADQLLIGNEDGTLGSVAHDWKKTATHQTLSITVLRASETWLSAQIPHDNLQFVRKNRCIGVVADLSSIDVYKACVRLRVAGVTIPILALDIPSYSQDSEVGHVRWDHTLHNLQAFLNQPLDYWQDCLTSDLIVAMIQIGHSLMHQIREAQPQWSQNEATAAQFIQQLRAQSNDIDICLLWDYMQAHAKENSIEILTRLLDG